MKALVLSGGEGTRLRPITYSFAKQLIPVANKPILFYVLEDIANAGIKEVGIIVGETREAIKEAVKDGNQWGLNVTYILQKEPLGLAHAVKIAENFICDEPFVMYLGDNILRSGIKNFVNEYGNSNEDFVILLNEVEHPEQFGVAVLDEKGRVEKLVEKPGHFISNKALVGIYILNHKIFQAVKAISPSWRGELEITDAIQYVIDNNGEVEAFLIDDWWKDTGKKGDVLEANRLILDNLNGIIKGICDSRSKISGRVNIAKNTFIKNSVIEGPVIIAEDCLIEDSYLGPYTSIGAGVQIINSEVEQSIVMENTFISNIAGRIGNSLIGREVRINNRQERPDIHELLLGDQSRIEIYK